MHSMHKDCKVLLGIFQYTWSFTLDARSCQYKINYIYIYIIPNNNDPLLTCEQNGGIAITGIFSNINIGSFSSVVDDGTRCQMFINWWVGLNGYGLWAPPVFFDISYDVFAL